MEHYAGIDVSLELTSVCVVDTQGKIGKRRTSQVSLKLWLRSSKRLALP